MARGLDHVVHAVHDLDAAAALYARLGFQVGARNRHPPSWGTQNHIVQFPGFFTELLSVAEPARIVPHAPNVFSFGAFNRDFLARRQGFSMLVLEGRDAHADAAAFRSAGIGEFNVFDFEREAKRPDGMTVKVAFSLAFAIDSRAPDVGFFACQHRFPENFWNPAFQIHANTATGVAGIVLVAENPTDHHIFLSAFSGAREWLATSTGITVQTPRGEIQAMTPAAFTDHFGVTPPDTSGGSRLAALRFSVRDLHQARSVLQNAGVAVSNRMGRLVVAPHAAMGATLVFEPLP